MAKPAAPKKTPRAARMKHKQGMSQAEVGRMMGLKQSTISWHVRKGHFDLLDDGSIDPQGIAKFKEAKHLKEEAKATLDQEVLAAAEAVKENVLDYWEEKTRVEHFKAEREAILLDELRGLKVDRQEMEDLLFTAGRALRDGLLQVAARLAARMVRVTDERQAYDLLMRAHREAAEQFADELGQYSQIKEQGA